MRSLSTFATTIDEPKLASTLHGLTVGDELSLQLDGPVDQLLRVPVQETTVAPGSISVFGQARDGLDSILLASATANGETAFAGDARVNGRAFSLNYEGPGQYSWQEVDMKDLGSKGDSHLTLSAKQIKDLESRQADAGPSQAASDAPIVASPAAPRLDLAIGLTPSAIQYAGGLAALQARVRLDVAFMNMAFFNNGLPVRIRLRVIVTVPIDPASSENLLGQLGNRVSTPITDVISQARSTYRADLTAVYTYFSQESFCGVAFQPQSAQSFIGGPQSFGYSVAFAIVRPGCLGSLAHELGHTMGLGHELGNANDNPFRPWAYGYYSCAGAFATIMAYPNNCATATPRIPAYSDPTRTYGGVSVGIAGVADNARALRETTPLVEQYAPALPTDPFGSVDAITMTPAGIHIAGWAIDPDVAQIGVAGGGAIPVHVYVGGPAGVGTFAQAVDANLPRADIGAIFPQYGPDHGFDFTMPPPPGDTTTVCVHAINVDEGTSVLLRCAAISNPPSSNVPFGSLDGVARHAGPGLDVAGWAIDPNTTAPLPVHIYNNANFAAATTAANPRPDVGAAAPGYGNLHGYTTTITPVDGLNHICAYAINIGPGTINPQLGCQDINYNANPFGAFDTLRLAPGGIQVQGWVIDPDTINPINVDTSINGNYLKLTAANQSRTDVNTAYPGYTANYGYNHTVPTATEGTLTVCMSAANTGPGANPQIGNCQAINRTTQPIGSLDGATRNATTLTIAGWALDPDTANPIAVHIYIDGTIIGATTANTNRPDVANIYPLFGPNHGYNTTFTVTPTPHQICAYAINQGPGTTNPPLGCVDVP